MKLLTEQNIQIFKKMKKQKLTHLSILLGILLFSFASCTTEKEVKVLNLFEQLNSNPDIEIITEKGDSIYKQCYRIMLKQPLDHNNPEKGYFEQKIYLSHISTDLPTVIITEGYTANRKYTSELADLLHANQIIVEHRYFGESMPDSIDWKYLNVKQAAADHHQIIELFKEIYTGKWISTGISKGGQTTLFFNYLYPNDVDAAVPYVAPLIFSDRDERSIDFLKKVGTKETRDKVFAFQKALLERKNELMPYFEKLAFENRNDFHIGFDKAYEYSVLEYAYAFWQWGRFSSEDIPEANAKPEIMIRHLENVDAISFFTDETFRTLASYFYQAITEMGIYTYDTEQFKGLLTAVENPNFLMSAPEGAKIVYNGELMQKVKTHLQSNGNNILYIYGEYDPWSACAVELIEGNTNALKMIKKEGSHRTRIRSFSDEEQKQMADSLAKWLEIDNIDLSKLKN